MADSGLDIGTLSGRVELEDYLSSVVDLTIQKIVKLDETFGGLGHTLVDQAASFFTAEAALDAVKEAAHLAAETLKEITIEGSHAADIEDTFDHLTKSAGLLGDELLGHMRDGVRGTVTDLDLMTRVNENLAVGLNLTDQQMKVVTNGAFALAKATGGDTAAALDKLSDAMVTGRVRGIQLLTGKIDLTAAEQAYADKVGVATDHLSAQDKQAAIQEVILDKVAAATARVGDQQTRLADNVKQVQVDYANFMEELGTSVALSPVVAAGYAAIKDALKSAFGGEQKTIIDAVTKAIENGAIEVLSFSKYTVDGVALAGQAWEELQIVMVSIVNGIKGITYSVEGVAVEWMKLSQTVTGANLSAGINATQKDMDRLYTDMASGTNTILELRKKQDDWAVSTGHLNDEISKIQAKMQAASDAEAHNNAIVAEAADIQKRWTDESIEAAKAQDTVQHGVRLTATETEHLKAALDAANIAWRDSMGKENQEELKKMMDALNEINSSTASYQQTVATLDPTMVQSIETHLKAGVAATALATAYGLTASQIKAVEMAMKNETDTAKLATKELEDSKDRWSQFYQLKAELSGSTTDKINADIQRWLAATIKSHVDAKTDTADFYQWAGAMSAELTDKEVHDILVRDTHSKAFFEQVAADAKKAFDFATEHSDNFTQAYIDGLQRSSEAAAKAADHWADTAGKELDDLNKKADNLGQSLTTAFAVTAANWAQAGLTGGGWGLMNDTIQGVAKSQLLPLLQMGFSLEKALIVVQSGMDPAKWTGDKGPRVPGFRTGGVGDFGEGTLAMLHGWEAITPLGANAGSSMGGGVVNVHPGAIVMNYPIMNDPRAKTELRNMLNDLFVDSMKNRGQKF